MAEQDDAFFAAAQFETQAVHVGSAPDPATGSVIPPIYQTSTFAQEEVGRHKGYEYAGTYRVVARLFAEWGLGYDLVDLTDLDALKQALRADTRLVWVETPTNPLLRVVDVAGVAELAHAAGARCVVDNTFATPFLQRDRKSTRLNSSHPSIS